MKKKKIIPVILLLAVVVISIAVINGIKSKREKEFKENVENDRIFETFSNGKKATYEELLAVGDIEIEDIHGFTIGLRVEGELEKFYIQDEAVVKELCERFRNVEVHGVSKDLDAYSRDGASWSLSLYSDKPYAITTFAYELQKAGNYKTVIWVTQNESDHSMYSEMVDGKKVEKDVVTPLNNYSEQMILNENIKEYIEEIYENHVKNITKDDIVNMVENKTLDMEHLFAYQHFGEKEEMVTLPSADGMEEEDVVVHHFVFPLDIDEFQMEVKLEEKNKAGNEEKYVGGVVLVSADGEQLDLLQSTSEKVKEFLNTEG